MNARNAFGLALLCMTAGCFSEVAVDQGTQQAFSRHQLNTDKRACTLPGDTYGCYDLGRDALQTIAYTKARTWTEPRDPALARAAWLRACANGLGEACAALVEYDLAVDVRERRWAMRRAAYLWSKIRSRKDVQQEQETERSRADELDRQYEQRLAAEAERDRANQEQGVQALQFLANEAKDIAVKVSTPAPAVVHGQHPAPHHPQTQPAKPPVAPSVTSIAAAPVCLLAQSSQPGQVPMCACFVSEQAANAQKLPGNTYTTVTSCSGSGGSSVCCCKESGGMNCQCSTISGDALCDQVCQNTSGVKVDRCGP